jgi:3-oxoacyl-[acyl-carrier-protein] synthase-3
MTEDRAVLPRPRCRRLSGVRIVGTGSYIPDAVVSNDHLHQRFGFDSDWIVKRTGILERRHAAPHQATSDLCLEASLRCLDNAKVAKQDVDLIVLATFTPDMSFPSTACLLQDRLGVSCPAIEIEAACAGFMYALITGAAYVVSGVSESALIVGGDTNSRVLNPTDVRTYPLFGDGAGAVLLTRGSPEQGIISYSMGADGSGGDLLSRPAGGSRMKLDAEALDKGLHYMYMDGRAVFRWAVNILTDTIQDVLKDTNLRPEDIDLFLPHQANIRIINAAIDSLKIPRSKVYNNLDRYGNTSAGSIPLALDEAIRKVGIHPGQRLMMSGFGAGLAWGTAIFRW